MRIALSAMVLVLFGAAAPGQQKPDCEYCPARVLIVADQSCELRVDGQKLAYLQAGDTRTVAVDLGEHFIEAKAGDVAWSRVLSVEKPGQIVVRTDISAQARRNAEQARKEADSAASLAAAARWAGDWIGGIDYAGEYRQWYTFHVEPSGKCEVTRATTFLHEDNSYGDRDRCTVKPDGSIDSTYTQVSADGYLTIDKIWDTRGKVRVRLQRRGDYSFRVRNDCFEHGAVDLAVAFFDAGNQWFHQGWFKVAQGESSRAFSTPYPAFYYYADTTDGLRWAGDGRVESMQAQVTNTEFRYESGRRPYGTERRDLWMRRAEMNQRDYTLTLTCK